MRGRWLWCSAGVCCLVLAWPWFGVLAQAGLRTRSGELLGSAAPWIVVAVA